MTKADRDEAIEALAARAWEIESADQMIPIPIEESRIRWQRHKDANSPRYMEFTYNASTFLSAASDLRLLASLDGFGSRINEGRAK